MGRKGTTIPIHTLGRTCPFRGFREEGSLSIHTWGTNFVHFLATGALPRMQSPNVHLAGVCRYGALQVRLRECLFARPSIPCPLSLRFCFFLSPFPPIFLPRELQCAKDLLHIDRLHGFFWARKKIRKIKQAIAVLFRFVLFSFLLWASVSCALFRSRRSAFLSHRLVLLLRRVFHLVM